MGLLETSHQTSVQVCEVCDVFNSRAVSSSRVGDHTVTFCR